MQKGCAKVHDQQHNHSSMSKLLPHISLSVSSEAKYIENGLQQRPSISFETRQESSPASAQGVEQKGSICSCRDNEVQFWRQSQACDRILMAMQHMAGGLLQLQ